MDVNSILDNTGQFSDNLSLLCNLLGNKQPQVRLNAVKDIGKLGSRFDAKILVALYRKEVNTNVRREIVSSIGRQRNESNKAFLLDCLADDDPKVICQAIRGLLVFKNDAEVKQCLCSLVNHPNEIVRTLIYKECYNENAASAKVKLSVLPHTETFDFLKNTVVNADVLEALKCVPDESVHLTFTSPPYYNARDYSIYASYQSYLEFLEQVFIETHRITKEGRFLIINTSPIIIPRVSRVHSSKRYAIPFDLHPYLVKNG